MDPMMQRIAREAGVDGLLDVLGQRLSPTDLQSLMLSVYSQRVAGVTPSALLKSYVANRFVHPSGVDVEKMLRFDAYAVAGLPPGYVPLELSPVAPLGSCAGVASVHQNKVVSTSRNTEVVADSTNVMALESAVRRQALLKATPGSTERVGLGCSHRLLRAQKFDAPGASAHFRLFSLTTAGRDQGSFRFELEALAEHLAFFIGLAVRFAPSVQLRVSLTDLTGGRLEALARELPQPAGADVVFDPSRQSGRGYYQSLCFKLHAMGPDGLVELGDGGFTDWTQALLGNHKERFLIGCVSGERLLELSP